MMPPLQAPQLSHPPAAHLDPSMQSMSMSNARSYADPNVLNDEARAFQEQHDRMIQQSNQTGRPLDKAAAQRALGVAAQQAQMQAHQAQAQQQQPAHLGLPGQVRPVMINGAPMYIDQHGRQTPMHGQPGGGGAGWQLMPQRPGAGYSQAQLMAMHQHQQQQALQAQWAQHQLAQRGGGGAVQATQAGQVQTGGTAPQPPIGIGVGGGAMLQVPPGSVPKRVSSRAASRSASPIPPLVRSGQAFQSAQPMQQSTSTPATSGAESHLLPARANTLPASASLPTSTTAPPVIPQLPASATVHTIAAGAVMLAPAITVAAEPSDLSPTSKSGMTIAQSAKHAHADPVRNVSRMSAVARARKRQSVTEQLRRHIGIAQKQLAEAERLEKEAKEEAKKTSEEWRLTEDVEKAKFNDLVIDYLKRAGYSAAAIALRQETSILLDNRRPSSPKQGPIPSTSVHTPVNIVVDNKPEGADGQDEAPSGDTTLVEGTSGDLLLGIEDAAVVAAAAHGGGGSLVKASSPVKLRLAVKTVSPVDRSPSSAVDAASPVDPAPAVKAVSPVNPVLPAMQVEAGPVNTKELHKNERKGRGEGDESDLDRGTSMDVDAEEKTGHGSLFGDDEDDQTGDEQMPSLSAEANELARDDGSERAPSPMEVGRVTSPKHANGTRIATAEETPVTSPKKDLGYLFRWWCVFEDTQRLVQKGLWHEERARKTSAQSAAPSTAIATQIAILSPKAAVRASSVDHTAQQRALANGLNVQTNAGEQRVGMDIEAPPTAMTARLQQADAMRRAQQAQIEAQQSQSLEARNEAEARRQHEAIRRASQFAAGMSASGPAQFADASEPQRQLVALPGGAHMMMTRGEYDRFAQAHQLEMARQRQQQQELLTRGQAGQIQLQHPLSMQAGGQVQPDGPGMQRVVHPAQMFMMSGGPESSNSPSTESGSVKRYSDVSPVGGASKKAKLAGKRPTPEEHQRQAFEVASRAQGLAGPPGIPQMPGQMGMLFPRTALQQGQPRVLSDAEREYARRQHEFAQRQSDTLGRGQMHVQVQAQGQGQGQYTGSPANILGMTLSAPAQVNEIAPSPLQMASPSMAQLGFDMGSVGSAGPTPMATPTSGRPRAKKTASLNLDVGNREGIHEGEVTPTSTSSRRKGAGGKKGAKGVGSAKGKNLPRTRRDVEPTSPVRLGRQLTHQGAKGRQSTTDGNDEPMTTPYNVAQTPTNPAVDFSFGSGSSPSSSQSQTFQLPRPGILPPPQPNGVANGGSGGEHEYESLQFHRAQDQHDQHGQAMEQARQYQEEQSRRVQQQMQQHQQQDRQQIHEQRQQQQQLQLGAGQGMQPSQDPQDPQQQQHTQRQPQQPGSILVHGTAQSGNDNDLHALQLPGMDDHEELFKALGNLGEQPMSAMQLDFSEAAFDFGAGGFDFEWATANFGAADEEQHE